MEETDFKNIEEIERFPFITAQKILKNHWTVSILLELSENPKRFSELRSDIDITEPTLTNHLNFLQSEGLVHREFFSEVPPRVEYSLTEIGKSFQPVLDSIEIWGKTYIKYLKERDNFD